MHIKRNNERGDAATMFLGSIVVVALLGIFSLAAIRIYGDIATHRDEALTVTKSERITEGKSSRYLIFTESGVYENVDSFWNGKWNSSDLYNELQAGKTYTCDVTGWRVTFLSWYPNLIECEETTK